MATLYRSQYLVGFFGALAAPSRRAVLRLTATKRVRQRFPSMSNGQGPPVQASWEFELVTRLSPRFWWLDSNGASGRRRVWNPRWSH